ncbi:MAG: Hsp20/alpha crystallin family protein [Acidimicrobiales bacterium]|nr:Hsp20/alpha crystallin family protein [Acidimicrobiales bacterium]
MDDWPRMIDRRLVEPLWRAASADAIKVEQFTDDDEIVIRAEIPGVDPDEDIEVSVTDNRLTISAHREQREESKDDDGFRSEFRYGSFQRVLTLPPGADADDVSATYDDGILEVRVTPDTKAAESAKVAIGKKG